MYGDGLTIDSDDGTEYIPGSEITKWELPKAESILAEQSLKETVPSVEKQTGDTNSLAINVLGVDIHKQSTSLPLNNNDETLKSAYLPEPTELKLLFTDKPFITEPDPCFDIPDIDSESRKEVDRWHNRYQYAQKIREPARMAQDVTAVVELAETLDNPALYCLAGCFADIGGLGSQRAKVYYEEAIKFDYQPAAVALATLYIKAADWANASKSLLLAIQLHFDGDKTPLVKKLGQCLFQMQEIKADRLGLLLSSGLEGDALEYAKRLVALVVKDESEAYSAALNGNIDILRKTRIGNDLFPWGDESPSALNQKKESSKPVPKTKKDATSRKGYISTYNVDRNFGFIVESSTGQTWYFHKKSIESETLLRGLIIGKVQQDIIFVGKSETISGKYPEASQVRILSDGASIESKDIRRTPLRVRLSGIPRDRSYYAKAKEAEQLDQLEKADEYFLMEISRKGKHFKSAIKDLANLKNRMGKSKEAITLLDKYKDEYNGSELSSLDQMKIQFFVKGQQYHDAAGLLAQIAKKTDQKK
ncbi:MAG: hypothetical protein AYP45_08625 [Candidatus Brocadia carolinensis]|uniref:CSD domain-containing protein n=1 Tax=Candidatus Brocadia carolinensis TaxID=1004156 RepID=A0A1V4ATW6_9BACT|nr:MAG: hypothetical protein AYP45_08625 [Candidatus Brocadia caroliniensis]